MPLLLSEPESSHTPKHVNIRCNNNTGTIFIVYNVNDMKVSGEGVKYIKDQANDGVQPAACAAADSKPLQELTPMPPPHAPHAPYPPHDTCDIDASGNSGPAFVLCGVGHLAVG